MEELNNSKIFEKRFLLELLFLIAIFLIAVSGKTSAATSVKLSTDMIKYVYDGDTFIIECIENFKCNNGKLSIRALALDTPEIKGECQYEKEMARAAKRHLVELKNSAKTFTITPNNKRPYDRYNRLLASVSFDGVDWAESMIKANLGRVWTGSRGGWCESE